MNKQYQPRIMAMTISGLTLIILGISFSFFTSYLTSISLDKQEVIKKDIEIIYEHEDFLLNSILDLSWALLTSELDNAIEKAQSIGKIQVKEIERELKVLRNLEYWFEHFNDNNNPLVAILEKYTRGVYFNIDNEANDPFIMITNMANETIIAIDTSGNCAIVNLEGKPQRTRTIAEENKQQANPDLSDYNLNRIGNHDKWNLDTLLYFQFTGKDNVLPLNKNEYDLKDLKDLYVISEGDYEYLFKDLEFLTPSYLYDDYDIKGEERVTSRGVLNEEANVIIYIMAFNFLDYIKEDNRLESSLITIDNKRELIKERTKKSVLKQVNYLNNESMLIDFYELIRAILLCTIVASCLGIFGVLSKAE